MLLNIKLAIGDKLQIAIVKAMGQGGADGRWQNNIMGGATIDYA